MQFSDSISNNVAVLEELIRGLAPQHRNMARRASAALENQFNRLHKDNPKNAAVAVGAAWAVFKMAEHLCEKREGSGGNLIQLLS
jgi:hypothetical protein